MDLEQALAHIDNLTRGLETRGRIGMAMGICMERYGLDDQAAFDVLRRLSQHQNRRLALIAEDVIDGSGLPNHDTGRDLTRLRTG